MCIVLNSRRLLLRWCKTTSLNINGYILSVTSNFFELGIPVKHERVGNIFCQHILQEKLLFIRTSFCYEKKHQKRNEFSVLAIKYCSYYAFGHSRAITVVNVAFLPTLPSSMLSSVYTTLLRLEYFTYSIPVYLQR